MTATDHKSNEYPLAEISPEEFMKGTPEDANARECYYKRLGFPESEQQKAREAWQRLIRGASIAFATDESSASVEACQASETTIIGSSESETVVIASLPTDLSMSRGLQGQEASAEQAPKRVDIGDSSEPRTTAIEWDNCESTSDNEGLVQNLVSQQALLAGRLDNLEKVIADSSAATSIKLDNLAKLLVGVPSDISSKKSNVHRDVQAALSKANRGFVFAIVAIVGFVLASVYLGVLVAQILEEIRRTSRVHEAGISAVQQSLGGVSLAVDSKATAGENAVDASKDNPNQRSHSSQFDHSRSRAVDLNVQYPVYGVIGPEHCSDGVDNDYDGDADMDDSECFCAEVSADDRDGIVKNDGRTISDLQLSILTNLLLHGSSDDCIFAIVNGAVHAERHGQLKSGITVLALHDDLRVRKAAISALGQFNDISHVGLIALCENLLEEDETIRLTTILTLKKHITALPADTKELLKLIAKTDDSSLVQHAAKGVYESLPGEELRIDKNKVTPLDQSILSEFGIPLGRDFDREQLEGFAPVLVSNIQAEHPHAKRFAMLQLGELMLHTDFRPTQLQDLLSDKDRLLRAITIGAIRRASAASTSLLQLIGENLTSKDPRTRIAALLAVRDCEGEQLRDFRTSIQLMSLHDEYPAVRELAMQLRKDNEAILNSAAKVD